MRLPLAITLFAVVIFIASYAGATEDRPIPENLREYLGVTVYSHGAALVKDQRRLSLEAGTSSLAFEGVSPQAQPDSAWIRPLCKDGAFAVTAQTFDFDVMSRAALLRASVGREVGLARPHPTRGDIDITPATLLSVRDGVVLQVGEQIWTGQDAGAIVFYALPEGLRSQPALSAQIVSEAGGPCLSELLYLSNGLDWRADTVVEWREKAKEMDLTVWATVTNNSGMDYKNARIQVAAGRVTAPPPVMAKRAQPQMMMAEAAVADFARTPGPAPRQSMGAFHLYDLASGLDLMNNQTKQLALFSAKGVKAKEERISQGSNHIYRSAFNAVMKAKPQTYLVFQNTETDGLGKPLPGGAARVYKADNEGESQYAGGQSVGDLAVGDEGRLLLGEDFDMVVERRQTAYQRLGDRAARTEHLIKVSNGKDEAAEILIREGMLGQWTIEEESAPHEKRAANQAQWTLSVPAKGEVVLTYRVYSRF